MVQPVLQFADTKDRELFRAVEIEVRHRTGAFKLRIMTSGLKNTSKLARGPAKACTVLAYRPSSVTPVQLSFLTIAEPFVVVDNEVDSNSAESIMNSLNATVFAQKESDIKQGEKARIALGFFLSNGDFYLASYPPAKIPIARGDTTITIEPFYLRAVGTKFQTNQSSRGIVIGGPSWEEAQVGLVGGSVKKGDSYLTVIEFPRGVDAGRKFKREMLREIKESIPVATVFASKTKPKSRRVKRLYHGFVVRTNSYGGFLLQFQSARFPLMVPTKWNFLQRVFLRKRPAHYAVWGTVGMAVQVNVEGTVPSSACSGLDSFVSCMDELRMSSTEADYGRLAGRYNFPIEFLKQGRSLVTRFENEENLKELKTSWKKEVTEMLRKDGYPVEEEFVEVETTPPYLALWTMYADERWQPIFRKWQLDSEHEIDSEVRAAERARNLAFAIDLVGGAIFIAVWEAYNMGYITFGDTILLGIGSIGFPLLFYLFSQLGRKPELELRD